MTRLIRYKIFFAVLAVGCADDAGMISVDTRASDGTSAAVVAYHNGARWVAAWPTTPGVFAVPAGPDVELVVACRSEYMRIEARYLVAEPGTTLAVPCLSSPGPPVPLHPATLVPTDATVSAGHRPRGLGGSPTGIRASAGVWDVVVATSDRVLIRRGVQLPPSAPLTFDVTADGTPLEPVAAALPVGDPGNERDDQQTSASYILHTAGGTRGYLPAADGALRAVPEALLIDGDAHEVTLSRYRWFGWSRTVTTRTRDLARIDTTLPDPIGRIETSAGARTVSWQGAPPGDLVLAVLDEATTWSVVASEAWLAENGGTGAGTWTVPELADVAGWDPAWSLDGDELERDWSLTFVSTVDEGDRVVVRTASDDGNSIEL